MTRDKKISTEKTGDQKTGKMRKLENGKMRETGDGRQETGDGRDGQQERQESGRHWGKFGNSIDSKTRGTGKSEINMISFIF
jgi:hypothetical protein